MSGFSSKKNKRKPKTKKKLVFLFVKKTKKKPQRSKTWGMLNKEKKHAFFVRKKRKKKTDIRGMEAVKKIYQKKSFQLVAIISIAVLAGAYWIYHVIIINAASATKVLTTQSDWEAGEFYNNTIDTVTTTDALQIKSGGVGTWDMQTPALPENTRGNYALAAQVPAAGADLTSDGSYLYLIYGNNLPDFWRYNPDTNTWKQLADAPTAFWNNSAITYYNGYVYAINGHDGTVTTDATGEFYKYSIADDTWTKLNNAPDAWGTVSGPGGADIESAGNGKIYAIQGNAQTGFWQFDTTTELWTSSPDGVFNPIIDPVTAANSHPLIYSDKSFVISGTTYCSSGCLYVFLGGSVNMYRYDIAATQWYGTGAAPLTPQIPAGLGSATTGSAMTVDPDSDIIYAFRGGNTEFMKYTVGDVSETVAGTWDALTGTTENTQRNVAAGSSLAWININGTKYVYGLLGGVPELARFDIGTGKWGMIITQAGQGTNANDLVTLVPNGPDCSDPTGCLFVASAATNALRRFDLSTNTWTSMTNLSLTLGAGADLCYDGAGQLFIIQGGTTSILVHNIVAGGAGTNGTTLTAPAAFGAGASITCTADNRFYALRGAAQVNFYYSASGANPVADDSINTNNLPYQAVSYGAALINDGTYVYALIGNGRGTFLRFDPSQASGSRWTEMATLPTATSTAAQTFTSALGYDGVGNIYAIAGHYQKDFWRYDIDAGATGTWTRAAALPVRMVQSMGITNGDVGGPMYVLRGWGQVGVYKFNPSASDYVSSATWVSEPLDLDYVSDLTTFSATHPTPGTSSISFSIRSSVNEVDWSAWENIVVGETGNSTNFDMSSVTTPNRRFLQVKVILNSDGTNTPTLSDISVVYEKDSSAPANPAVAAYSNPEKTTTLTNSGSYYYTNPYFEFTPATQTESPIAGYYVTWTTESNFDPSDTGAYGEDYFQTADEYLVRRPMTRSGAGTTWYLRVAVKDQAGNVANPETKFQYTYTGINDATVKTWTTQGDFTAAGTTMTNVEGTTSPDNVKLSAVSGGAWTNEAALPATANNGSTMIYSSADKKIYILRGVSTNTFWSYDTNSKIITTLASYGGNVGTGSSMIYIAPNGSTCRDTVGCIFASQGRPGANALGLQRYNIGGSNSVAYTDSVCGTGSATTANTWTACTSLPAGATSWNSGGSLAYNNSDTIYALAGNGQLTYRYSLSTNAWTLMSNVDNAIGVGGTLTWTPNGTGCSSAGGCLYATRGASTTHYYVGSISAMNGSVSWSYGLNTPLTMGDGGAVRRINDKIYYSRGGASSSPSNEFFYYDLTEGVWGDLANTPTNLYQGSEQGLAYNSDTNYLYTLRGYSETSIFAYDLSNDNWKRTPSIPNFYTSNGFSAGALAYDSTSGLMYVARGNGVTDFWSYNFGTDTWRQLADVPHTVTTGADARYVNHSNDAYDGVYLLAGAEGLNDNITYFYRYNPVTDIWVQLSYRNGSTAAIPEIAAGADLSYDGADTLYTSLGGSQQFLKYDIPTNTWIDSVLGTAFTYTGGGFVDVTSKFNAGGSANYVAIFDNNTDYVYLGSSNKFNGVQFYLSTNGAPTITPLFEYCTSDNCGTATSFTPSDGTSGMTTSGLIYFNPTTWNTWSAYSVNGSSAQYWIRIRRQNATQTTQPMSNTVKVVNMATPATLTTGSCLIKVDVGGTDYLYATRGGGTATVYRYNLDAPPLIWESVTNAPGNFNNADTCVLDGPDDGDANIIMPQGTATNMNMFVLNPSAGTWTINSPKTLSKAFTYNSGAGFTDVTTQFNTGGVGNNVDMFGTRFDYVYIGSTDRFNIAQFALNRNASSTITPAFGYCTTADCASATAFTPVDNTVGMTTSGQIGWDYNNWPTWTPISVNGSDPLYYIRIQRTAVTVNTIPQSDTLVIGNPRMSLDYFVNGALVQGASNTIVGFRGNSTGAMSRYVVSSAGVAGYEQNGSWISEIIDFNAGESIGLYSYAGLNVTMTDATDTYETVETRTCNDVSCADDANDSNWGAWTAAYNQRTLNGVDYYSVGSDVGRYGQVRVRMTSDQVLTPTIQDLQWSYYVDSTAPNNPTTPVGGYTDSSKATGINNDTWSNDLTPYFEWTSSDDTDGIGIDGYYVSFCSEASGGATKDPITDANDVCNLAYNGGTNYYPASSTGTGSWNALTQSSVPLGNGVYYLRIKTKDRNGNITSSTASAFTYKVDGDRPGVISDLSVATYMLPDDSFTFSWTDVSDVGPSGVNNYCYHTGSSGDTCVAKEDICSGSVCTVTNIPSYQPRVNNFYVLAEDEAGNDAASYASTGYFYTGGAPTAPQSVTVDPLEQVDTNTFTISWDLPGVCLGATPCAASDILRYCYTINEEPSTETCGANFSGNPTPSSDGGWTTSTQTASRILPSFSAATLQGENTVYVVAMDVVSNIDYTNVQTATFDFTSNAPGVPASVQASDTSDRATNKYSVVLTWDEPADVGSGVESYKVYRCEEDCENPSTVDDPPANYTNIAEVNTLGYLDTGLNNTITYSYFARATGTGSTQSGNSAVVEIKPEGKFKFAPTMSGLPTATAYIRSATIDWLTLNDQDQYGNIIDHPATSFVEYGTTSGYGDEDGDSVLTTEHSVTLINLTPDTTYHYRCRWQDQDGNIGYSPDYTFTTKGAPSAPINLTADPDFNTENSFSFSWDEPADEGVTVAGYYYSINNIPNENNSTYTEDTSVGPLDAASQQGANTFYVVAIDDGGNINYANYASVDFEAYTTPPTSPQAITITDSSDRDASRYSITITWDPPEGYTLEDEIYYTIYRSSEQSSSQAGNVDALADSLDGYEEIATITSTGYLDTGLDNTKEYFYQVTARDKAQATSDPTDIVSEIPEGRFTQPPAITVAPTVTPDSFSASVAWETERIASSFVEYGLSSSNLTEEQGTADLISKHDIKLTGLQPLTTYYYRIKSIDIDENAAYSEIASFTTLEAPRVLEVEITDIKLFDAIVSWETNKESTAVIQYGTTANYGFTYTDTSGSYALTHTVKLEGLTDSSLYHLRIGGQDRNGNPISSDDYTFNTLTFPEVISFSSRNQSEGQTEISWTTNVPTTSEVEYWGDSIAPKTQGNTAMVTEHVILLYGLEDASRYKFKVRGSDAFGYEAVSGEGEFVTLEDTTPPVVSGVKSESNTVGSGEESKVQIIISWKTDEPTTSKVEYGVGVSGTDYTNETEENAELVMDHLALVDGLSPAKTYHFRVVSRDKAGNEAKSGSYTVLTSRTRESFLQLIISNLEETFSWIGRIGSTF